MHKTVKSIAIIGATIIGGTTVSNDAFANDANWTGFYGGLAIGGMYGESKPDTNGELTPYFTSDDPAVQRPFLQGAINDVALNGSVLAGYDRQYGDLVFGLEADISAMDYSETNAYGPVRYNSAAVDFNLRTTLETNFAFSIRPKVGYSYDNWMFHAAAGPSIRYFDYDFSYTDTNDAGVNNTFSESTLALGISTGLGASYKLEDGWTLRGDYVFDYYPEVIDERQSFLRNAGGTDYLASFDHQVDFLSHNVRIALIKRF